jgi:DNA invertase Pin-like site-specific DNA recombinase
MVVEAVSGKNITDRPALTAALARLDAGDADILLATRVERLSGSVRDFADLMERATRGARKNAFTNHKRRCSTKAGLNPPQ